MYFCHSSQVWQQFPQLAAGLLLVDDIEPQVEVEARLQPWYERARKRLEAAGSESQLAEVAAWRRAYSQMGLKPTQYRSAAEALLRRFRRGEDIPRLHPLVDLCNAVSLAFALPVAVFDLAGVDSYLEVRHARGDERYLAFSGEIEQPAPEEIIFAGAADQIHARRWTFRQSRQSTVGPETRRALVVSEGLHETAAADVRTLIEALANEIKAVWSPPRRQVMLSAESPRLEFD